MMSVNGINERYDLNDANEKCKALQRQLEEGRIRLRDRTLAESASGSIKEVNSALFPINFKCRRTLQGHTGKVYSLDWSHGEEPRDRIVSASQDGRLIVWNALTSQKTHAFKLPCQWVMTCAFSSDGSTVACGGLDNYCFIYQLNDSPDEENMQPKQVLRGHKGYISCCQYVPGHGGRIITSSGDRGCILWDIESGKALHTFGGDTAGNPAAGHTSDVMSLSINPSDSNMFVSGSCDMTARLWDCRSPRPKCTFYGHTKDINAVQFLSDGRWFGTGSDDGKCKIFDTRYGYELQVYSRTLPVTSIAFSSSGRILIASYHDGFTLWDSLRGQEIHKETNSNERQNQISCVRVSSDGTAICAGSWDNHLRVYTYDWRNR